MDNLTIPERINKILIEKGIPKSKFYKDCNITSSAFSQWNTGRTVPKQQTLRKIADYLKVNYSYLLTGVMSDNDEFVKDDNADIVGGVDDSYRILHRRIKKLTPEQRRKLCRIGEELFEDDFKD